MPEVLAMTAQCAVCGARMWTVRTGNPGVYVCLAGCWRCEVCGGGFRDGEACNCSLCPTCGQKLSKQPTTQENFALGSP